MALSNLFGWVNNSANAGSSCGTACGAGDKASACGAGDK